MRPVLTGAVRYYHRGLIILVARRFEMRPDEVKVQPEPPEPWDDDERKAWDEIAAKHAARNARRRAKWESDDPVKVAARQLVAMAVRAGLLVRPEACERCDAEGRIQAHHPDYSLPLAVLWLCARCHRAEHPRPPVPKAPRVLQPKGGHPGFGNPLNLRRSGR